MRMRWGRQTKGNGNSTRTNRKQATKQSNWQHHTGPDTVSHRSGQSGLIYLRRSHHLLQPAPRRPNADPRAPEKRTDGVLCNMHKSTTLHSTPSSLSPQARALVATYKATRAADTHYQCTVHSPKGHTLSQGAQERTLSDRSPCRHAVVVVSRCGDRSGLARRGPAAAASQPATPSRPPPSKPPSPAAPRHARLAYAAPQ